MTVLLSTCDNDATKKQLAQCEKAGSSDVGSEQGRVKRKRISYLKLVVSLEHRKNDAQSRFLRMQVNV